MYPEAKPGSHIILGQGVENLTSLPRRSGDVVKLAHALFFFKRYELDENGIKAKERAENNMKIMRQYFDKDFLPETRIRSFKGVWFTQQEFLPVENFIDYRSIINNPQLIPKIESFLKKTNEMHEKTGYCIDLFGFNKINEIIKTLALPDYWSIPNLVITKDNGLKIFDWGLYLDNNIENTQGYLPTVSMVTDPLFCKLELELEKKITEKIHCQKG